MPQKSLFDLSSESLDLYFAREIEKISPQAKDALPRDLSYKLFRRGGDWDAKSTSRLSFLPKLFVLLRALKKRFFLAVEDDKDGMGVDQFCKWAQAPREKNTIEEKGNRITMTGPMILANKELCNAFQYLNDMINSGAYKYMLRNKNVPPNKADEAEKEMQYIVRFLTFWETNRKVMTANTGVSIPEFYVLLSLYDGESKNTAFIYKDKFKRAYQSSPRKIKASFGVLQAKGYISKTGENKGAKMQITPLGKDILRQILRKYAIDC